jgi:hypothetical protein
LVKNLGLVLLLASHRAVYCCLAASHGKSPPHFAQRNANTRGNKRMVQFTSFKRGAAKHGLLMHGQHSRVDNRGPRLTGITSHSANRRLRET